MTYEATMQSLEKAGTAQNRKIYSRHGAKEPMFGVSWAHFAKLIKQIKRDDDLAIKLWDSGNYDARLLATMIVDPAKLDEKLLDRWAKGLNSYPICDAVAKVVAQSPVAAQMTKRWRESDNEFIEATGWNLVAYAARSTLTDAECIAKLKEIEKSIHSAKNRVKHVMNQVVICIGSRGGAMTEKATAAAKRIGKVEVDHGETDCKTPDAIAYIQKVLARNNRNN